jgi:Caspase domain
MRRRSLGTTVLLALAIVMSAVAGRAQDTNRGAQKRPDGSLIGMLGGSALELGTFHALLIGINDYQNPDFAPKLRTAVNDVQMLARVLIDDYGFKNVKLLLDRQASRAGVLRALAEARDMGLGPADNLLIYYAGHGHRRPDTHDGFWIPSDATADEFSWISVSDIRRILKNVKARHTLLVSDSCFSGTLSRATVSLPSTDRFLREVFLKDSYQVISSGGLEPVADGGRDGLSLFAYNFIGYLKQQTRPYVTAAQLYSDVAPLVANASGSRQTPEHGKIPDTFDQNGQFIFARSRGGALAALPPATAGPLGQGPGASPPANLTRIGAALFAPLPASWQLRPESLSQPGAVQLPFHSTEKGAQIRIIAAPMSTIEIARDAGEFRENVAKSTLESFREAFAASGLKDWKNGPSGRATVDGLEMFTRDAAAGPVWVRAAVVRNDTDGHSYVFILMAPQKFQKDVLAEYDRLLASWKWTRP